MTSRLPYKDDDAEIAIGHAVKEARELRVCWKCNKTSARRLTPEQLGEIPEGTKQAMDQGLLDIWFCPCGTYQNDPRAAE